MSVSVCQRPRVRLFALVCPADVSKYNYALLQLPAAGDKEPPLLDACLWYLHMTAVWRSEGWSLRCVQSTPTISEVAAFASARTAFRSIMFASEDDPGKQEKKRVRSSPPPQRHMCLGRFLIQADETVLTSIRGVGLLQWLLSCGPFPNDGACMLEDGVPDVTKALWGTAKCRTSLLYTHE